MKRVRRVFVLVMRRLVGIGIEVEVEAFWSKFRWIKVKEDAYIRMRMRTFIHPPSASPSTLAYSLPHTLRSRTLTPTHSFPHTRKPPIPPTSSSPEETEARKTGTYIYIPSRLTPHTRLEKCGIWDVENGRKASLPSSLLAFRRCPALDDII
jgi:hypothetical protein